MTLQNILTIALPIIAIGIAIWQGFLAKFQLDQAKETKKDTEKLLDEIKDKINKIEEISNETRQDVKGNISKIIDKQDENLKLLLKAPSEDNQNAMMEKFLPSILTGDITNLEKLVDLSNKMKNKKINK